MWNLGEPGSRFRAAAPNHPEALLEEPQATFQAVGETLKSKVFGIQTKTKSIFKKMWLLAAHVF